MGHFTNNILTVLQRAHGWTLQQASDSVGAHCKELADVFESAKRELPSFGVELDHIVA